MSSAQVIVLGAGAQRIANELTSAGIVDVAVLDAEPTSSVFDEATDSWTLSTAAGEVRAGVVVTTAPPLTAWIPKIPGRNDFHGASFHAARWCADFDPAGKHIAVIGADSIAADHLKRLSAAAAVTVFAHPPRRIVAELASPTTRVTRWLTRRTRAALGTTPLRPALVAAPISAITPRGIRTSLAAPGVEHRVDAIIFGTGFTVSDQACELVGAGGVRIAASWRNGAEPFLGIAIDGFPNYFCLVRPEIDTQTRYIVECLTLMKRSESTRIEVLGSSMQVFNERAHLRPAFPANRLVKAFDLSSAAPTGHEIYDGAATLTVEGASATVPVRVRLTGRLDPIDGRYHWRGTLFDSPTHPVPDELLKQNRAATLTVGDRSAAARIVERTPWGTHSIAGVGAPPYAMTHA